MVAGVAFDSVVGVKEPVDFLVVGGAIAHFLVVVVGVAFAGVAIFALVASGFAAIVSVSAVGVKNVALDFVEAEAAVVLLHMVFAAVAPTSLLLDVYYQFGNNRCYDCHPKLEKASAHFH